MIKDKPLPRSTCPLANGLDILGDRWTILIVRDLMLTDRREYGQLLNAGEGISTNILSQRLSRLQETGVITKHAHPDHGKKVIYELTDKGLSLAPVLIELSTWARDNLKGTELPQELVELATQDRQTILERIYSREPIVVTEAKS